MARRRFWTRTLGALLLAVLLSHNLFGAELRIGILENVMNDGVPGITPTLKITADSLESDISGFRIVFAYDRDGACAVVNLLPGQFLKDCDWEYFDYRWVVDTLDNGQLPPTNLIEVTGLASLGGDEAACHNGDGPLELVELAYVLDFGWLEHWGGQLVDYRLFWRDCGDNVLYSRYSDTVFSAASWLDPEGEPIEGSFPGWYPPGPLCEDTPDHVIASSLKTYNGGLAMVDVVGETRGDVNLNGLPLEAADAVQFSDYFTYGMNVFTVNVAGQVAATDVNADGITLSVQDLVYMIRMILREVPEMPEGAPAVEPATLAVTRQGDLTAIDLNLESAASAVYLRFVTEDGKALDPGDVIFNGPHFQMGHIGDTTTMLLIDMDGSESVMESGSHTLLE